MPEQDTHRILVVDDQRTLIEWLRVVLATQPDFVVDTCADPLRSADVASAFRPTLILQDLIMPKRHGFELLAEYRAREELVDVPVIVLSSIEDVAEKARSFSLGAADYVVKMPDPTELVARVRAHSAAYITKRALVDALTARLEAERIAAQQSSITRAVIESMHDAVLVVDAEGKPLLLNEVAERLFGPIIADGIPREWPEGTGLFHADRVTRCTQEEDPLRRALRGETVSEMVLWVKMPGWSDGLWHSVTGSPVRDRAGNLLGAVNVGRDIGARKQAEESVQQAALQDHLTGLFNRRGFSALAEQQLKLADRAGTSVFAVFIDLDGLKRINDEEGHEAGDGAIAAAGTLLRGVCRSSDVLGRLGGDEFAIVADGGESAAERLRERILAAAQQPVAGRVLSLSVGIALREAHTHTSLAELLAAADQAMYEVKRRRRPSTAR